MDENNSLIQYSFDKNVLDSVDKKIFDTQDLRVGHLSGEYLNNTYVGPEDIIYFLYINKKTSFTSDEIVMSFKESDKESVNKSIQFLLEKNIIGDS